MPKGWTCPKHSKTFLQSALEEFARQHPSFRRGMTALKAEGDSRRKANVTELNPIVAERYACPQCVAAGAAGYLRPATKHEIEALENRAA